MNWRPRVNLSRLLAGTLLALLVAACGDDASERALGTPTTSGTSSPTTTTAESGPRLKCPGDTKTFEVTGPAVGDTLAVSPSAEDAMQEVLARRPEAAGYIKIGDEPDGARYALVAVEGEGDEGVVIEEVVVGQQDGGWTPVQYTSCDE